MEAADLHRMSPTMISSLPPKRSARHSKARLSARRIRIPNARCPGCPGSLPVSADGIATTSRPVRRPCEPDGPNLPTGRKAIVLQWLCKMCESRSSRGERVGVRGYGLSIGRNPSPGSLCDPTSPFGRGETELAAGSDSKFMARTLLVPRLQIALAMIAAQRTPWRAVAAGFGLIARARFVAAGALHQHPAALAVGDQAVLAGRLERFFGARGVGRFVVRFCLRLALHRTRKIRACECSHLFAKLLAQHAGLDLLDLTFGKLAQLERTVGNPDQAVHFEPEMRQHIADFAVLAFADRKHQPDIGALVALQRRVDRTVFDAVDFDALFQFIELALRDFALGADAIAPQPAGIGQFERARQAAIIGQQQQALGIEIEPADADQPRQSLRQIVEHRRPSFRVGMGGHQAARLVKHEQPRALARRQRLAVDGDDIVGGDVKRRRIDHAAVDGDAALHDPFLGVAARSQSRPRHHLGDALAGFLLAGRPGCAFVEIGRALPIGAAAAERRTLGENLSIVLLVAARPVGVAIERPRSAARMLLPGAAPFTRTLEFRTILAGTVELGPFPKRAITLGTIPLGTILAQARKVRTLIAAAVVTRFVVTGFVEISGAVAGGARVASGVIGRRSVAL